MLLKALPEEDAAFRSDEVGALDDERATGTGDLGLDAKLLAEAAIKNAQHPIFVAQKPRKGHIHAAGAQRLPAKDLNWVSNNETDETDGIAAHIPQRTATQFGQPAHVVQPVQEIGKCAAHQGDLAHDPLLDQFPHFVKQGMVEIHGRFGHDHPSRLGSGDDPVALVQAEGQGLFTEDVFAGLGGADGPPGVEAVGQRDIDHVDLWIGQQRFVASMGTGDAPLGGIGLSPRLIPAGDGKELGPGGRPYGRDQASVDAGRGKQAPAQYCPHIPT